MFGKRLKDTDPVSLLGLEVSLDKRRRELAAEIEAAQAEAAEAALDNLIEPETSQRSGTNTAVKRIALLRADLEASLAAIQGVRLRRREALQADLLAKHEERLKEAGALRTEADRVEKSCAPLLAKLSEIQGVNYTIHVLGREVNAIGTDYASPRSVLLREQAARAESMADDITRQSIKTSGTVTGSADEIFAALASDPNTLAPTRLDCEALFAELETLVVREEPAYMSRDSTKPRTYVVAFRDGAIDRDNCSLAFGGPNYGHRYSVQGRILRTVFS